ncbi:MAG TPA: hypothetical protein VGF55_28760 [Gemmataceae bacterium]
MEVLVFKSAGVQPQVLADDVPHGLEVLLGRHLQAFILDVGLAQRLQQVTGRGHRLAGARLDVPERPVELVVKGSHVPVADEFLQRSGRRPQRPDDAAAVDVLQLALSEDLGEALLAFFDVVGPVHDGLVVGNGLHVPLDEAAEDAERVYDRVLVDPP